MSESAPPVLPSVRWSNVDGSVIEPEGGLATRGVIMGRVRPIRWLWRRRIPLGFPSLIVGEEDVGKGTLMAWLIAQATRGALDGNLAGEPIKVLIIGDEDGFEAVWVPRIEAVGGDLEALRTLDDYEYLDDLTLRTGDLEATVRQEGIGWIVFDQLLDHVDGGKDGSGVYNPKAVRHGMLPLRRVAGSEGIAVTGLLHPIKGKARTFRELIAGSHQFNAVSRSSLLLGKAPEDKDRRVLVRGKGNHSAVPRSFEFGLGIRGVDLNGHCFEEPFVADPEEGDRTIEDLLDPPTAPVADDLAEKLYALLTDEEQSLADLARAVGRDPKDGSVRNALRKLAEQKRAVQNEETKGWKRC